MDLINLDQARDEQYARPFESLAGENASPLPNLSWLLETMRSFRSDRSIPEPGGDCYLILEALCGLDMEATNARFEQSGQILAEQGGNLSTRLTGLHTFIEDVSRALSAARFGEPLQVQQLEARLRTIQGATDRALVSGFLQWRDKAAKAQHQKTQELVTRLNALQRVNSTLNSSLDLDQTLSLAADSVAEVMHADLCSIFLHDELGHELILRATNGPSPYTLRFTLHMGEGYSGWVASQGQPLAVHDALLDSRFSYEAKAYATEYRGLLSMPIILFTVEKLEGVISVQSTEPRNFTPEEFNFLEIVAGQLAMSIENGRLYEQTDEKLRRKIHELSTLHRVSAIISSTLDLNVVLNTITTQAVHLSGGEKSSIFELDAATGQLQVVANYGLDLKAMDNLRIPIGECCVGTAVQTGRSCISVDCPRNGQVCHLKPYGANSEDIQSVLCVPLKSKSKILGAICVYTKERHTFSTEQIQLVVTFANEASIAIENARLYEETKWLFEETKRGLEMKSTLLKEMHHRVKNNLQMVAALLSMQQRHSKSPVVAQILSESVTRIQSIAATHDLLSHENSEHIGATTVEELVRKIISIVHTYMATPELKVQFTVISNNVIVASKQATVLSLIINELISNAIKHGFVGRQQGSITIEAEEINGFIFTRVIDDGVGVSADVDESFKEGMGVSLVKTLVQADLRGTFTLENDLQQGLTIATVSFPSTRTARLPAMEK